MSSRRPGPCVFVTAIQQVITAVADDDIEAVERGVGDRRVVVAAEDSIRTVATSELVVVETTLDRDAGVVGIDATDFHTVVARAATQNITSGFKH